jgi:MFS family permease
VVGGTQVVASAALTPLIPLYVVARGAPPAVVGLVAASAAVLPLLLAIWTGVATDVVGVRRMSILASVVLAAAIAVIAGAPTIPLLMIGTAVAGMANNALILATQTSVAHASRPDNRDHYFGYFAFWISVGQLVGPVLGGALAEASSIQTAIYACAGMSLVPGVAALWLPRPEAARAAVDDLPRGLKAREVYGSAWRLAKRRDLQFVMLVAFVIIFSWSIKSSFYPLYLKTVGLPTSLIGTIFSILGAGSMVVRPLVGTVAARYGIQRVLMGAVAVATLAIGVTPLLRQFWPLALAALSTGMAWGFTQPLTMSLIAGSVAPAERGLALSLRMTSNRLAEVVSPIVFGGLIAVAGLGSAFFLSAGVLAAGLLIIARFAAALPSIAAPAAHSGTEAPTLRAPATGSPRERPAPASPDRG